MGFQGVPITVDLSQRTTSTQKELSSCAQLLQSWPSLSLKYFSVYMKSRPIASCCRTALTLTMVGQHSKTSWAKTMSSKKAPEDEHEDEINHEEDKKILL